MSYEFAVYETRTYDVLMLPRLFERFYRGAGVGGVRHRPRAGQALVTAQGGTLRAGNDRETGGARFDLTFPKVVV